MHALRIFHWNLIAGNFFTQDCEKKLIVRDSKNVFMHARNGAWHADIGQSVIAKCNIVRGLMLYF